MYKNILKYTAITVGIAVLLIGGQALYYSLSSNNITNNPAIVPLELNSGAITSGEYLSGYIGKINDPLFKTKPLNSNFGKTFGIGNYRGALPNSQNTISLLEDKYGIKTIISLIPSNEIDQSVIHTIQQDGIQRINIPLSRDPPTTQQWDIIKSALAKGHAFVHCVYGADRTGAIIARARVELEGISPDEAYQDMLTYNPKVEDSIIYKKLYSKLKNFIYNGVNN